MPKADRHLNNVALERAIVHAKDVAEKNKCTDCGAEHLQLVEWLTELQMFRAERAFQQGASC